VPGGRAGCYDMKCPKCAYDCPPEFAFCPKCGTELQQSCSGCGFLAPVDFSFCPKCGSELGAPEAISEEGAPDRTAERLQRLVPKAYAERLLATRGQVQAERRMVTILFSDVKGSTAMAEGLDPEDVMEIMDGAFDVLIEPVYRYEGTLARLMGDAVLAFFGAPIAHEDDPERAIRAALEITAEAAEYAEKLERERGIKGFNVRVGINTGLVVVGEVGSDLRVEYTAMGDAINLAARMEQNAPPGGILIPHDTYRHVRGVFDVVPQEPQRVKGKTEPVQTYLVQRAKPRAFRKPMRGVEGIETRMIGRQAELSRLQEAFYTAMEDRELQVFTITGDVGVGKSRLLHEFDIWAEVLAEQYYFFKGRARQQMQNLPYSLLRDLFAFRFQIQDTDPLPVVREKLEQGVHTALGAGEESRMRAHFIGHLVGFEFGPSSHLAGVLDDPKQIHDRALTYLADYFKAMATQLPVLILLEDLQWADDSSLDALNYLALALINQPVMIVSAARPALFERRPHWGEGQAFHTPLPLRPLSKRNTRRLLDEILQMMDTVPALLRDMVVTNAEGNPFFVEELIKMLIEDGLIVKAEDAWQLDLSRLAQIQVPSTLTGVVQARLDRLPLHERTILQQASVVGRLFWDQAVVRINDSTSGGVEGAKVLSTLSALRGREMVFQRETTAFAGAQEYIFKHTMLREVTYESVLKRLRRAYHSLVADWLMEQGGERAGEYTALIADHLELAGRTAEATDYLLQAGDRARGLYSHQEAIGAYQRALALLKEQGDHERAARTLMKLGLTHHTAFDYPQARQAYEEGFVLWQQVGQTEPAAPPPPAPHALRLAEEEPLSLDPGLASDIKSGNVIDQLFSGLVELSPELDVLPDVARSWEVLEGGRKYVFHLRDDVRWSDGTPVKAGDFEYAWKRVLDPATGSRTANLLYDVRGAKAYHQGQVANPDRVGVRAPDDATLVVQLEGPTGYFLHLLTYNVAYPVPRHVVQARGAAWAELPNIVTNGPFRLAACEPGESMLLERNPAYHGRFAGNLRRVELSLSPERVARLLEMYDGNHVDTCFLELLTQAEWDLARQRFAEEYVSAPSLTTFYTGFDVNRPPFDDPQVRRAFTLATDRETLAHVAMRGYLFPATGGLVPPGMPGHSPGIGLPYDPERARHLLAEAGYPSGRGFPVLDAFVPADRPFPVAVMEYLQAQWLENLGVEITFSQVDWGRFLDTMGRENPHMWPIGWRADYPDPDSFLRASQWRGRTKWQNEAFDALVEGARRVMDQEERMRMYQQADRILVEEAPILPLLYYRQHLLVKPWLRKYPTSPIEKWFWKDVVIEPH
jgi:ABC-type oligopeptide transport system substrate-binding subunit/class 3 adenylate cyclase/tetratricopeptide (TPR) repeat protein